MRTLSSFGFLGAVVLLATLGTTSPCSAQRMIWGDDAARAARPGAYVPYDAAPLSHRMNYFPESSIFLWGSYGRSWELMYQMDRQERFEKFGTRYGPANPPLFNRLLNRWNH